MAWATPPEVRLTSDVITEIVEGVDLSSCETMAASERTFGNVVVTVLAPGRSGKRRMVITTTKSLGDRVKECVTSRLHGALAAGVLNTVPAVPQSPAEAVTIVLGLGRARAILPPLESFSPLWQEYLESPANRPRLRARVLAQLPPDARLSPEGCLWLPASDLMCEAQRVSYAGAGPALVRHWLTEVASVSRSNHSIWAAGTVISEDLHLLFARRGDVRPDATQATTFGRYSPGRGCFVCLVKLSERQRAEIQRRISAWGNCWAGDLKGNLTRPRIEFPRSRRYQQVSVSQTGACAVDVNGDLVCCGRHDRGIPATVKGPFIAVTRGIHHACALGADGKATCWGGNAHLSHLPAGTGPFRSISAGGHHTCAVSTEGRVLCSADQGSAVAPTGSDFTSVTADMVAGGCALRKTGTGVCWDRDGQAEIGPVRQVEKFFERRLELDLSGRVSARDQKGTRSVFSAAMAGFGWGGGEAICAADTAGAVHCTGGPRPPPERFRSLAASGGWFCGVTLSNEISCWGRDSPPGLFD